MKRSIFISGIVCANLMMSGSLFKIFHLPGAGTMLVLSVFLFCFVFLPLALMSSYKQQSPLPQQVAATEKKFKSLHIVTFIVFFIGMMSVLFKVMHWPGAGLLLPLGLTLPFVLFLPVYLYQTRNEKQSASVNFPGIMFGLTFLAVFSVLLSQNVSRNVLDRVAAGISNNEVITFFSSNLVKAQGNQNDISKNAQDLCSYIDGLKCELLTAAENDICENNSPGSNYDPSQIYNMDNTEIPTQLLFGKQSKNRLGELKIKIDNFREALLETGKVDRELSELIKSLFETEAKKVSRNGEETGLSWEEKEFAGKQLIVVLGVLTRIQSNARLVESEYLSR